MKLCKHFYLNLISTRVYGHARHDKHVWIQVQAKSYCCVCSHEDCKQDDITQQTVWLDLGRLDDACTGIARLILVWYGRDFGVEAWEPGARGDWRTISRDSVTRHSSHSLYYSPAEDGLRCAVILQLGRA